MPDYFSLIFDFLIQRPLVMLFLLAIPFFVMARRLGVYPSRRLLYFSAVPALASILLIYDPLQGTEVLGLKFRYWMLAFVSWLDVLLLIAVTIDFFLLLPAKSFSCTRDLLRTVSQGKKQRVEIELWNFANRGCRLEVKDDLPPAFEADPPHFEAQVKAKSRLQFNYEFVCNDRGQSTLECVHLKVHSPLRLWQAYYQVSIASTVNVYPDMKQITEYDLLARTNRLSLMGVRRSRKIGQDNEFERLRDYSQDDNYRHIDWRATARRQTLTVRDFQTNQSQRVIFMVDCGRMMTGTANGISLLDHSLNAMLMLSYVALRQGDSVGLISFSDRIHNFTPAKGSVKQINHLLHASFNQHAQFVESRYDEAFLYLRTKCLKRSLVVLITNVIDEVNAIQIKQYLSSLTGRHLPVGVLLRDRELFQAIDDYEAMPIPNRDTIYQAAAATEIVTWRDQLIRDLKHQGVLAMDVFPEHLTADLVNQYLEIKARHLL